jgi:hypothetical protein
VDVLIHEMIVPPEIWAMEASHYDRSLPWGTEARPRLDVEGSARRSAATAIPRAATHRDGCLSCFENRAPSHGHRAHEREGAELVDVS